MRGDRQLVFANALEKSKRIFVYLSIYYSKNSEYTFSEMYQEGLILLYKLTKEYQQEDLAPIFLTAVENRFRNMTRDRGRWRRRCIMSLNFHDEKNQEVLSEKYEKNYPAPDIIYENTIKQEEIADLIDDIRAKLKPQDVLVFEGLLSDTSPSEIREYKRPPKKMSKQCLAVRLGTTRRIVRSSVARIQKTTRETIQQHRYKGKSVFEGFSKYSL